VAKGIRIEEKLQEEEEEEETGTRLKFNSFISS
jgi:hypothetical protein